MIFFCLLILFQTIILRLLVFTIRFFSELIRWPPFLVFFAKLLIIRITFELCQIMVWLYFTMNFNIYQRFCHSIYLKIELWFLQVDFLSCQSIETVPNFKTSLLVRWILPFPAISLCRRCPSSPNQFCFTVP